jgi:hypothetical protein
MSGDAAPHPKSKESEFMASITRIEHIHDESALLTLLNFAGGAQSITCYGADGWEVGLTRAQVISLTKLFDARRIFPEKSGHAVATYIMVRMHELGEFGPEVTVDGEPVGLLATTN